MSIFLLIIAALGLALGAYQAHSNAGLAREDYDASQSVQRPSYPYHLYFNLLRNFQIVGLALILIYLATQYLRLA